MMQSAAPTRKKTYAPVAAALRVVVPYIVFASLWILLSDRALRELAPDLDSYSEYSIIKGAFFVLASGGMLFLFLHKELSTRRAVERDRAELLALEQAARARAESAS